MQLTSLVKTAFMLMYLGCKQNQRGEGLIKKKSSGDENERRGEGGGRFFLKADLADIYFSVSRKVI